MKMGEPEVEGLVEAGSGLGGHSPGGSKTGLRVSKAFLNSGPDCPIVPSMIILRYGDPNYR